MANAAVVENYRTTQKAIVRRAERELRSFWLTLNPNQPVEAIRALENYLPLLIESYGEMGAAAAADFYEELRETSPRVRGQFRAAMGPAIPVEQTVISAKWAVGPIFREEADSTAALSQLLGVTDRLVKQQGRDTVARNIIRDPAQVRYARVPSGSDTCTYCLMLASRGAEYLSKESASSLHKYHNKCDCVPTPIWDDFDLAELKDQNGYDPDELYDRWQEALEAEKAAKVAK